MFILMVKVHKVRMRKICKNRKSVVYANGTNQRSWWNVCPWFLQSGLSVLCAPIGSIFSDFIWPFLTPYNGSHSQSKNGLYFPNFMYFSAYFPNFYDIFSKM